MSEIATWLAQHDLGMHASTFEANDIDLATLLELTDDDLRELGLSLGHRRKLLRAIREAAPPNIGAQRGGDPERRQITVLFADVVGFTRLSQRLDPEELLETIEAYQKASGRAVIRYGGVIAKYVGDGLVAVFGWPRATEIDACNAVRSGLAIIEEVKEIRTADGDALRVRVGIATGLSVVGDLTSDTPDVLGDVPNLAERLQAVATPDNVIIPDTTKRLVDQVIDCESLGEFDLKGFQEPVAAWRVVGERRGPNASARSTTPGVPLVDRHAEMAALRTAWAKARNSDGSVLCIRGEAGFGKTRIVSEFVSEIKDAAEVVRFFGLPDAGQSALRPIADHVETLARFRSEDSTEARLVKIERMLRRFGLDSDVYAPIYAQTCGLPTDDRYPPTGLSPERQKTMLFEGIANVFKRIAKQRPAAIVFEDLHWLDPTTRELAAHLTKSLIGVPVFILMTTRPEVALPLGPGVDAQVVQLARLDKADAADLLRLQSGISGDIDVTAAERILERSGGVPLYIEELTKSAVDVKEGPAIPITLQDSLMARLDRLGNARRIAQMASVIGLDFSASLLAASLALPLAVMARPLDQLVQENILSCERGANAEEQTYRFRHALLAEAAYESQLRRTRRTAHAAVAEALLQGFPMQAKAAPQVVARHLEAAGRPAEASPLYRTAGLTALRQAHYQEALELFRTALSTLEQGQPESAADGEDLRQTELEILSELGTARIALEGFGAPEVGHVFDRAEALGRAIGPGPALARALWGAWLFNLVSGNLTKAIAIAEELLGLGRAAVDASGDAGLLMEAKWAMGDTLFWLARFDEAHEALRDSISLFDADVHGDHAMLFGQDPYVAAQCYKGYTQWARSDHEGARSALKAAVARAREINHPFSTAWALCFGPVVSTWRDEPWVTKRLSEAALAHTEQQIMPFWQSAMTIVHGWARLRCGEMEEGLADALSGLELYQAIGSETVQPFFRGLVGECLRIAGEFERADEMVSGGFDKARRAGERVSEIWLHIFSARLKLSRGDGPEAAEVDLRTAIEMSRRTGAVELELTAAVDLDRLPQNLDRPAWVGPALSRAIAPRMSRTGRRALALAGPEALGQSA